MNLSFRRCDVGWGLPCPRRQGLATAALFESERRFIDVENRFHLLAVVDRHFPEAHDLRSEEHTSELQSLMRISYAVFCLKKKKTTYQIYHHSKKYKDVCEYYKI